MHLYEIIALTAPMTGTALMLSITIGVTIYMASKILNDQTIASKGKAFLISSLETIFILILFVLISGVISYLFSAWIGCSNPGSTSCSPIYLSQISLQRLLNMVVSIYSTFYIFDIFVGPFIQSVITFPIISGGITTMQISIMPLIGLDIILDFYYTLMQKLVDVLILVVGRIMLVEIAIPLSAYLLPFAVVFRAIPATKRVGSSLFALILVIYYVFPISTLMSDYLMFHDYRTDLLNPKTYKQSLLSNSVKDVTTANITAGNEINKDYGTIEDINKVSPDEDPHTSGTTDPYTIEEALSRIAGGPLSLLKGKVIALVVAPLVASFSSMLQTVFPNPFTSFISVILNASWLYLAFKELNPVEWEALLAYSAMYMMVVVAQALVIIFTTLIMEILISVTSYRALSKLFGGDVTMLGLTKVV